MKDKIKEVIRNVFEFLQHYRMNLLPNHFYSNIPDFRFLKKNEYWKQQRPMTGINGLDTAEQFQFVKNCVDSVSDKSILESEEIITTAMKTQNEYGYGTTDADLLYCFVNHWRPKKIVQIGCGISTSIILRAAEENNFPVLITCIEPYPSEYLLKLNEDKKINLIKEMAQLVPLEELVNLEDGDLFFMDSTHTVKAGSEVNYIILDVLPRLKKGVFVHFHDIYFPFDYQRDIEKTLYFWNESTLLHAFLINNSDFMIACSLSMIHYQMRDDLRSLFPNYIPQEDEFGLPKDKNSPGEFPAATYLKVI